MNKSAVITGATKGIGRAIAIKLAEKGYDLALCARSSADLAALSEQLTNTGVQVVPIVADCSIKADLIAFCEAVFQHFPSIDVLVNNVGIFRSGSLLDEDDETFETQQKLNVNATYYLSKYFGKVMRKQQHGHIFNICSIASKEIIPNAGSYSVTKTAMLSLNHVLRKELSAANVKVTAILPGSTLTASWTGTTIDPSKFVQPADIADSLFQVLQLSKGVNVDEIVLTPLDF